jgi:hypothetical protein
MQEGRKVMDRQDTRWERIKEELKLRNPEALLIDGFDRALIGTTLNLGMGH